MGARRLGLALAAALVISLGVTSVFYCAHHTRAGLVPGPRSDASSLPRSHCSQALPSLLKT
jgi:hypothetical protein